MPLRQTVASSLALSTWLTRYSCSLFRRRGGSIALLEARTILAEIYGWFPEGSDTADLKDAKALLDEIIA
jgi:hypothetical protein